MSKLRKNLILTLYLLFLQIQHLDLVLKGMHADLPVAMHFILFCCCIFAKVHSFYFDIRPKIEHLVRY